MNTATRYKHFEG